jgi:hypothetical protein
MKSLESQLRAGETLDSLLANTAKNGECMEWLGSYSGQYPSIRHNGKTYRGNRLSLMLSTGESGEGFWALHKCDNPKCINPKHLYWGTPWENVRDVHERNRRKTKDHCRYGHKIAGENIRLANGYKVCRTCEWYRRRGLKIGSETKYETGAIGMISRKQLERACELYSKDGPQLSNLYGVLIQYVDHIQKLDKQETVSNSWFTRRADPNSNPGGSPKKYTDKTLESIKDYLEAGYTTRKIAQIIGCSQATVMRAKQKQIQEIEALIKEGV